MKRIAWVLWVAVGAVVGAACSSGGDTSQTGSTASGGGAGTAQGGSAQGGSAQAGTGGTAQGGSAQAGTGGTSQGGTSQGGTSQGGTSQGGTSQGGTSQGGKAGGSGDCCATVKCSGANPVCVEGSCFDLKPGECFSPADCGGAKCEGLTICGCGMECFAPTKPGHCAGAASDWAKCGAPGDCTLAPGGCCAGCGMPTAGELDAVNRGKLAAHHADVCDDPTPACPKCASQQNPDLLAACALGPGKCLVVEVSKNPLSSCQHDADCTLRAPQCCSCGEQPASGLVAIAKSLEAAYMKELGCANVDCAPCAEPPTLPAGVTAKCDQATHHCKVAGP